MKRFLALIVDKFIDAIAPKWWKSFEQMDTKDWLAEVEANHDSWEPDELWAAQHKLTDPHNPPCGCESVTPTAAVASATAGGGGHLLRDELIEELVDEYRTKLYEWFR